MRGSGQRLSRRGVRRSLGVVAALVLVGGMLTGCELSADTALGGAIITANGATVGHVTVTVWDNSSGTTQVASAVTDAGGNYAIKNTDLAPGTYRVRVAGQWYGSGATSWATATPVTLVEGTPERVDMVLASAADVTGSVVYADVHNPMPGVVVSATDSGGHIVGVATTGSDGSFDVGVPPGATVTIGLLDTNSSTAPATLGGATPTTVSPAAGGVEDIGALTIAAPTQVSTASDHACAVVSGSTVRCWGANDAGQLGDGTTTDSSTPVVVSGLTSVAQVVTGDSFTCAMRLAGTVKCWGANDAGQLGDGTTTDSSTPVTVSGLGDAVQITAADDYVCVLHVDETVSCWGSNAEGQLGDGSTTDSPVPVRAKPLNKVSQVSAGYQHTCVTHTDETVSCWGSNSEEQLGNGTFDDSSSPVAVPGLSDVTQVTSGRTFTCVLHTGGTVSCWGWNYFGQLGNDSTQTQFATPQDVDGITDATRISAAGASHTCAVLSSAKVMCWGLNNFGQVGNPANYDILGAVRAPKPVIGLTDATQVSTSDYYTCAVHVDTSISCWGSNDVGQFGSGTVGSSGYDLVDLVGLPAAVVVTP